MRYSADAVVVGAGPGGASTAHALASLGRRVLLLERHTFPRDKSCGDGLTRPAVAQLSAMGAVDGLSGLPVEGVTFRMRGKRSRGFIYPPMPHAGGRRGGLVVPRLELDQRVQQCAVEAGAELWENTTARGLTRAGEDVSGVVVSRGGQLVEITSPVVVCADGATSPLGRAAGLVTSPRGEMGYAIRGYYSGIASVMERLEVYMPLLDATDRYILPSYGWVFPVGPDKANVGVGLFERRHGANVRELMGRFVEWLMREDDRFAEATPEGPWRGAPVRFDFVPERCAGVGVCLVGDAAGMVSPFTGEGISYALESGRIAAQVIDRQLSQAPGAPLDMSPYADALRSAYTGYFETGREATRRYVFLWHVLESTFDSDRPLFHLCRRGVLSPEGLGLFSLSQTLGDVRPLLPDSGSAWRADLLSINQRLADTVRDDWPFLGRLALLSEHDAGVPFRPALLLLLCSSIGRRRRGGIARGGAAVELGALAALAQFSVDKVGPVGDPSPATHWGNSFSLMVGDLMLSKALVLAADIDVSTGPMLAQAISDVCEGYAEELLRGLPTPDEYVSAATRTTGGLLGLACELGAHLAGADAATRTRLRNYGRAVGAAYHLAEDWSEESDSESNVMIEVDARVDRLTLPLVLALHASPAAHADVLDRLQDPNLLSELAGPRYGELIDATRRRARDLARIAVQELSALPLSPVRRSLECLAVYAATRDVEVARCSESATSEGP